MYRKIKQKTIKITEKKSGFFKQLLLKTFHYPDGQNQTFFVNKDRDSAQVLAITADNQIILVKQFRPGPEEESIELPAGAMEKNEEPIDCAIRELKEETGYTGDFEYITGFSYSPYSSGLKHIFLARNCKKISDQNLDSTEFIKVIKINLNEFREKIKYGEIGGFEGAYLALDSLNLL